MPGKFNILADRLSRMDKPLNTEWALDQLIVNSIFQMLNYPSVDLFVTCFNLKLTLYVSSPGQSCLSDRRIINELKSSSCLCISSNNSDTFCSSQDTAISVQNSPHCPSLAPMPVDLRGITAVSIRSNSSSALPKTTDTSKRKVSISKSPITQPSRLGVIKQSIRDKKFLQNVADVLKIKTNIKSEGL